VRRHFSCDLDHGQPGPHACCPNQARPAASFLRKGVNIRSQIRFQHCWLFNCSAAFLSPLRNRLRSVLDPVSKESGAGQKLAEINQLPQRRDRGGRVPFHANTLAVDRQRDRRRFQCGRGLTPRKNRGIRLTRRVRSQRRCLPWHDPRKSRPRNPGQLFQLLFLG